MVLLMRENNRVLALLVPLLAALVPLLAALHLVACKPDITGGNYFCGPEAFCPPNLACQLGDLETFAYNCVIPISLVPFECPEISIDKEPDNSIETVSPFGTLQCGAQLAASNWGCIPRGSDVDHFKVTTVGECGGANPRFQASIKFPVGSAPLLLELLNEDGTLVEKSELCTSSVDMTGTDQHCLEVFNLPPGDHYLRVSIDPDANADCGGSCRFNRYQLFASSPVI